MFPTLLTSLPVETNRTNNTKSVLLAHIIATASDSMVVTDKQMSVPPKCKGSRGKLGHVEGGKTICLHSLAVAPKLQGAGLGKMVHTAFLQRMKAIGAERVGLLCQDVRLSMHQNNRFALRAKASTDIAEQCLLTYYERFGYKHMGQSNAKFGGGGWHDMVFDLAGQLRPDTASSSASS